MFKATQNEGSLGQDILLPTPFHFSLPFVLLDISDSPVKLKKLPSSQLGQGRACLGSQSCSPKMREYGKEYFYEVGVPVPQTVCTWSSSNGANTSVYCSVGWPGGPLSIYGGAVLPHECQFLLFSHGMWLMLGAKWEVCYSGTKSLGQLWGGHCRDSRECAGAGVFSHVHNTPDHSY